MKPRQTYEKRRKEQARQEKKREKERRRAERKDARDQRPDAPPGVDPDIAHIKWCPQPILEDDPPSDEETNTNE